MFNILLRYSFRLSARSAVNAHEGSPTTVLDVYESPDVPLGCLFRISPGSHWVLCFPTEPSSTTKMAIFPARSLFIVNKKSWTGLISKMKGGIELNCFPVNKLWYITGRRRKLLEDLDWMQEITHTTWSDENAYQISAFWNTSTHAR